jgi:ArsR family transcriptional regulator
MKMQGPIQENTAEQAALFSALADPTRLRLLKLLCRQRDPDALCVNALAALLGVSQPAVSQHLRVLKSMGLVKGERRGYHMHYSVNQVALRHSLQLATAALTAKHSDRDEPCQDHCSQRIRKHVGEEARR